MQKCVSLFFEVYEGKSSFLTAFIHLFFPIERLTFALP